jgi:hypothetical protein
MTVSVSAKDDMISVMKWLRSNDATTAAPLFAQFFFGNSQNASLDVQCHCWESCDACQDSLHQIDGVLTDTTKPRSTPNSMMFDPFPESEVWQKETPNLQVFSMYFDDDVLLTNEGLGALFSVMEGTPEEGSFWMQLDFHAGAMTKRLDTAFSHRKPGWFNQVWASGTSVDVVQWSKDAWAKLMPFARMVEEGVPAGYGNYIDADKRKTPRGFFNSTDDYVRAQEVKCSYNPRDVFKMSRVVHMQVPMPDTCSNLKTRDGTSDVIFP